MVFMWPLNICGVKTEGMHCILQEQAVMITWEWRNSSNFMWSFRRQLNMQNKVVLLKLRSSWPKWCHYFKMLHRLLHDEHTSIALISMHIAKFQFSFCFLPEFLTSHFFSSQVTTYFKASHKLFFFKQVKS